MMKREIKLNRIKLIHAIRMSISKFRYVLLTSKYANAVFLRNGGQSLINLFLGMWKMTGLSVTSGRVRSVVYFVRCINGLARSQGIKGLVLYLKACAVTLQQSLGGQLVTDVALITKSRVGRTSTGIPTIIPRLHRQRIREGDFKIIQLYLTLFNAYRVLSYPGRLKLNTITGPFTGTDVHAIDRFIPVFVSSLERVIRVPREAWLSFVTRKLAEFKIFNIFKSGVGTSMLYNFSSHPLAVMAGARVYGHNQKLRLAVTPILELIRPKLANAFSWFMDNIPDHVSMSPVLLYVAEGKLAPKYETAGKIRIFAMVDAWTNWFLRPLHDLLFSIILNRIPQDGTFDQMRPVWELLKRNRHRGLFSLDLTAATDRIPVVLQQRLLAEMLDAPFAASWKGLMVDRQFALTVKGLPQMPSLRYAVGQPMGALSSWAMLAITHHFIVQSAAWQSGILQPGVWYTNYAVLGDDLVIGNPEVKKKYLLILDKLGVQCGLAKSLVSPKGEALEFAKRTVFRGVDVSPIPFKEVAAASSSIPATLDLAAKYSLSFPALLGAYGYGFRVLGSLSKPITSLNSRVRNLLLQLKTATLTTENLMDYLKIGSPTSPRDVAKLVQHSNLELKLELVDKEVLPLLARVERLVGELNPLMKTRSLTETFLENLKSHGTLFDTAEKVDYGMAKVHIQNLVGELQSQPINDAKALIMDMLIRLRFLVDNSKYFGTFETVYFDLLYLREDLAKLPIDTLQLRRVDPDTLALRDSRVPYHILMWKRWAPFVQGTKKIVQAPVTET